MSLLSRIETGGRVKPVSAFLLTLLFVYAPLQLIFFFNGVSDSWSNAGIIIYKAVVVIGAFFIFYLKKGSTVRRILFILLAVFMVFPFMMQLYAERGHIGIQAQDTGAGLPFCHIASVNEFLSLLFNKEIIFPGRLTGGYASVFSMFLIWFWATILIGKGWCSWGCFYGGWDTLGTTLTKKHPLKISEKTAKKLRIIPVTLLIAMPILSIMLITPFFCEYMCPFKTVTEFSQVTSLKTWFIFLITVTLFMGSALILPIFYGKRLWCTYGCPFGVVQGLVGRVIRPFSIKINKEKCINCNKCLKVCLTDGITEDSLAKGKTTLNCSLCMACADNCPTGAIKVKAFCSDCSPASFLENAVAGLDAGKLHVRILRYIINVVNDILTPQSLFYFFALTVYFTFFSGFFIDTFKYIGILLSGGKL